MKKAVVSFVFVGIILASCKKEQAISTARSMDVVDTSAQVKHYGQFVNGAYGTTMGSAKVLLQQSVYTLVLDSFNVSGGPDLHVYLSKEMQPIHFIDLGRLRTTNGTQVYSIAGMPDFNEYKFALIHCQQFNHLFGYANIQ